MRTPLSYSSRPNRARPLWLPFCTGGHDFPFPRSRRPAGISSVHSRSKLPAPTAAPANSRPPRLRSSGAYWRSIAPPPSSLRSRAPALTETLARERSAVPEAPPWSHDPAGFFPALPPWAFPAWHRSATTGPTETNPIRRAVRGEPAIRQIARAPAPIAPGQRFYPAPLPPPPPAAPTAERRALPESTAHVAPSGSRSGSRTPPNSNTAAGGNTPTLPP